MTAAPHGNTIAGAVRLLAVLFGDQLDQEPPALDGLDRSQDAILMAEVAEEATHAGETAQAAEIDERLRGLWRNADADIRSALP